MSQRQLPSGGLLRDPESLDACCTDLYTSRLLNVQGPCKRCSLCIYINKQQMNKYIYIYIQFCMPMHIYVHTDVRMSLQVGHADGQKVCRNDLGCLCIRVPFWCSSIKDPVFQIGAM